jgi:sugar/nucleoside kinase (ribokinase family)
VLCAVGDLIEDVVVRLHDDIRRDTDTPSTIVRRRGGSAANVAYFAAKLTGASRFVGCVGSDPLGDSLVAQLTRHGVDVCGERIGRTGSIVVITSPDGDRTMLTDRGSATQLSNWEPSWLDGVEIVHLPLYSLSHGSLVDAARHAVDLAKQRGVRISIDLSSVMLIHQLGASVVRRLLCELRPDVVFCTRDESRAVATADWRELGTRLLVVKDGVHPIRVSGEGVEDQIFPVDPIDHVVDSTGAGDAFAAGFLSSMVTGRDIASCVAAGRELASRVIVRAGATLEDE